MCARKYILKGIQIDRKIICHLPYEYAESQMELCRLGLVPENLMAKISLKSSRTIRFLGVALLAFGAISISWVILQMWLDYTSCLGQESPVPTQGCQYIPQLVTGVVDFWPTVMGVSSIAAGLLISLVRSLPHKYRGT